uniref:Uncharacterized protein n=1 Tax=Knipowitschia caucasica TaxID=637954 RepID=A0AAV2KDW7_KNICA
MAMEQGRVTEFEGKSLDQIQIEPEGRAVEILSQTDGLKETSSGEPSTIHPDAPHGSGSAPSERLLSKVFHLWCSSGATADTCAAGLEKLEP